MKIVLMSDARLHQWAMRAADHINGVRPARAAHLGGSCEYAALMMNHRCECGRRPLSWDVVYAHILREMARREAERGEITQG